MYDALASLFPDQCAATELGREVSNCDSDNADLLLDFDKGKKGKQRKAVAAVDVGRLTAFDPGGGTRRLSWRYLPHHFFGASGCQGPRRSISRGMCCA